LWPILCICLLIPRMGAAQTPPQDPPAQSPAPPPEAQKPWWQTISFGGDFRLRFETFRLRETPDRNRARFRLRLEGHADVDPDLSLHFRLATGNPADPTTSNQTFKGFLTKKPFAVDYAFASYHPDGAKGLTFVGGKFEPPNPKTDMTWEENINWEGGYEQYESPGSRPVSIRLVASQVSLDEVEAGADSFMFANSGQLIFHSGAHSFSVSLTDQFFHNADLVALAVRDGVLDTRNTNLVTLGTGGQVTGFQSEFHLVDVLGRGVLDTGAPQYPLKVTADLVTNLRAASDQNRGVWLAGAYGLAEQPKTVSLSYTFADIQQEAVLSPFTFDPLPGSNIRMNMVEFSFMPKARRNIDVNAIFYKPLVVPAGQGRPLMKDLQFSFRFTF